MNGASRPKLPCIHSTLSPLKLDEMSIFSPDEGESIWSENKSKLSERFKKEQHPHAFILKWTRGKTSVWKQL